MMSNDKDHYRFEHFDIRIMMSDLRFSRASKRRPALNMHQSVLLSDGSHTTLKTLSAGRPLILITGSLSCPMTISSLPVLRDLLSDYQIDFSIALVYVREAHPGEHYPQPETIRQKLENACLFNKLYEVQIPVIVDNLHGSLHRELDTKPNSLHIFRPDGEVLFQSLWSGDIDIVSEAFTTIAMNKKPHKQISERILTPFLRGAGYIHEALKLAGAGAERELMVGAPPVWLLSRIANAMKMTSPEKRGWLAMLIILLVTTVAFTMLLYVLRT